MEQIATILGSRARFKAIEALACPNIKLPLRHIAIYSGLQVRAIQVALDSLEKLKVVTSRKLRRHRIYQLNCEHPLYPLLIEVFNSIRNYRIKRSASTLSKIAKTTIEFNESASDLFHQIKA